MKVRIRRVFARDTISWSVLVLLATASLAFGGELADAAMNGHRDVVRALLQKHVDVNAPQADGTTALHWAVRRDDVEMADLLIRAGARVGAVNRDGATPMQLAALNGNASMLELLIAAGADPNASLSRFTDTAVMLAARTGKTEAMAVLLNHGASVNARETWGGTTPLMFAAAEHHPAAVKMLIERGADVNARSYFVPAANGRGFEGRTPVATAPDKPEEFASGLLTPLMFAAREDDLESARLLIAAGARVNATGGDG
ncbi:MAG TPA: ankyrin repeat domain-containing protein, partial [Vicinamibacterales bacterium]|nr:ankyrin repeat domain-containing protein [Vicinamibacterales bacterium]